MHAHARKQGKTAAPSASAPIARSAGVRAIIGNTPAQDSTIAEPTGGSSKEKQPEKPDSTSTVVVQVVSGSKPAKGAQDEGKIFGGKKGGHVVIDMGPDGVFGFSNEQYGAHVFSRRNDERDSKFEHYTAGEWQKAIQGKQVVTFTIPVTEEQRRAISQEYLGEPTVDYSVLGYRCASYALHVLDKAGVVNEADFKIKYLLAVTPASLVRYLAKKGFAGSVHPGRKTRIWNTRSGALETDK